MQEAHSIHVLFQKRELPPYAKMYKLTQYNYDGPEIRALNSQPFTNITRTNLPNILHLYAV